MARNGVVATIAVAALAVGCATSRPLTDQIGATDPLPAWDYGEAARAVTHPRSYPCGEPLQQGEPTALRLLAWRTFEGGNGRFDQAFWWATYLTPDGPRWVLAMTHRRYGRPWGFVMGGERCEGGMAAYRKYDSPPLNPDAITFAREARPMFWMLPRNAPQGDWFHPTIMPGTSWRLREVAARPTAWVASFGEAPPADFRR